MCSECACRTTRSSSRPSTWNSPARSLGKETDMAEKKSSSKKSSGRKSSAKKSSAKKGSARKTPAAKKTSSSSAAKKTSSSAPRKRAAKKGGQARGRQQKAQKQARTAASAATGGEFSGKAVAEFRQALTSNLIRPLELVMLSRQRIEEALEEVVTRGRMTRDDASQLAQALLVVG